MTLSNGTQQNANSQVDDSCSLFGPSSWFANCIWIPLMSWLGSWFLTIGAAALVFAGWLFDLLVQYVILQFGTTLSNTGVLAAITDGWDIFRDLSNIVIIGMFTFIAIMIILGNQTYGEKKLISRVLIVAVLINFSLLFAKIVIDAGNFTAYQVYSAIENSSQFQVQGSSSQFDIADAFLRPMGITSAWNTQTALETFGLTVNSGVQAFILGLVEGLLLIMLAIVLLYGCFLIAARAVTLVVLMVTASIAFASYLHPTFSQSQYGFKGWWKSLVNASLFGPLLMLFLAISLMVVNDADKAMQSAGSSFTGQSGLSATVFTALSNPNQAVGVANGWTVIMLYIFGIGLLFISFRLSSSLASSAGGLNFGQVAWDKLASGAKNGASGAGGLMRRYGFERFAYNGAERRTNEARKLSSEAIQARLAGNTDLAERLERQAAQRARGAVRLGGFAGEYKKTVDTRGKQVGAVLGKAQPSEAQRADQVKAADVVRQAASANAEAFGKELKGTQEQTKQMTQTLKDSIESNAPLKAEYEKNLAEATGVASEENAAKMKPIDERASQLREEIARGGGNDARRAELQKQLMQTEESRKSELRHQEERMNRAHQVALLKTAKSESSNEVLKKAAENLESNFAKEESLQDLMTQTEGVKKQASRENVRAAQKQTTNALIDRIAAKQTNVVGRVFGVDNDFAAKARSNNKTESENGRLNKLLNKTLEQESKKEGGEH